MCCISIDRTLLIGCLQGFDADSNVIKLVLNDQIQHIYIRDTMKLFPRKTVSATVC